MRFLFEGAPDANILRLDLDKLDLSDVTFDPTDLKSTFELGIPLHRIMELPNVFLRTLNETKSRILASSMLKMLHAISSSEGTDFHTADLLVEDLTDELTGLMQNPELKLLDALAEFSDKLVEPDDEDEECVGEPCFHFDDRKMLIATVILSKIFAMVINEFLKQFDRLDYTEVILYPMFENAIRNSGEVGSAFIDKLRAFVGTFVASKDPTGSIPNMITKTLSLAYTRRAIYYKLDDPANYLVFLLVVSVMNDIERELSYINKQ